MKVLIDCGASDGAAINDLVAIYGDFDIVYAIEPNPDSLRLLQEKNFKFSIVCLQNLVCTHSGIKKLFLGSDPTESSVFLKKTTGSLTPDNYIAVECLDFSKWLQETFTGVEELIVLKMDIEGAEFDVLEEIIRMGQHKKISEYLVEWHVSRFPNPWALRFRRFMIKLRLVVAGKRIKVWR